MLSFLKRVFSKSDRETIRIFEETTKLKYEPDMFLSLKALTISNTNLRDLTPLEVFKNLEILNISNNKIQDIESLESLKKLKILDLRFNQIEELPDWVFKLNKKLHWERRGSNQEGIFLEGNPLDKSTILNEEPKIIVPTIKSSSQNMEQEPDIEELIPLNRQHLTIFTNKGYNSNFINLFLKDSGEAELKLNISSVKYFEKSYEKFLFMGEPYSLKYAILVLNDDQCCIYPSILKEISKRYSQSGIFLIIEGSNSKNSVEDKISSIKKYNKSRNIIEIYNATNVNGNQIKEKIYEYLQGTREVNSLWRKDWITLRDEIESMKSKLSREDFEKIATNYKISPDLIDYLFNYLVKVGTL